jgi:energy-coupling factor transporter ATP-binding protein EcfA2
MPVLTVSDFKGFYWTALNLSHPLTILVGPNGSGKSNFVEALEFLAGYARGIPLNEFSDLNGHGKVEIRGGLPGCPTLGIHAFSFIYRGSYKEVRYNYRININAFPPRITDECLYIDDNRPVFEFDENVADETYRSIRINGTKENQKLDLYGNIKQSALWQFKLAPKDYKNDFIQEIVDHIVEDLIRFTVLDPKPHMMREYQSIGDSMVRPDGANLSAVLHHLSKGGEKEQESLRWLAEQIKAIPEEPFSRVHFVETEIGDVIFGFIHKDKRGEHFISAKVLSDGTLRILAVLTALETAMEGQTIIIEEFDNGLHPSRIDHLLEAIRSVCRRRKIRVIVTTHNPATLNGLKMNELEGVMLCHHDEIDEANHLTPLLQLPYHVELLERGRLGDLVTRQIVDEYLSPDFEEKRKEKTLKWLEGLS